MLMTLQLPGPFAKSAEIFASTKNDCDEYDGSDSAAQSQQAEDRLPGHGVQKSFILCTEDQAYAWFNHLASGRAMNTNNESL